MRAGVRFVHADGDDQPGGGGDGRDEPDRGAQAEQVGGNAGDECADGVAAVAPQPVDADGADPPDGVGDVADDGEQDRGRAWRCRHP
jgi:hypothetical protein